MHTYLYITRCMHLMSLCLAVGVTMDRLLLANITPVFAQAHLGMRRSDAQEASAASEALHGGVIAKYWTGALTLSLEPVEPVEPQAPRGPFKPT